MANKNRTASAGDRDDGEARPLLADAYPTIARWASGYGWVELGIDGLGRPFVRALDEGGMVWEGQGPYETLDEALRDLEDGLARFMQEEGFNREPSARPKTPGRSSKKPRRSKDMSAKTPRRTAGHPAGGKVKKLDEIAEALHRGERFSITRLTTIKGLCEDATAAGAFALFLARKIQKRMREKKAPERYRQLVNRAVRELKPYLDDPTEDRRERLRSLLREIEKEQDEYVKISWTMVRTVKSFDLIVVEDALKAVLRPSEAPFWLYDAARDYTGKTDELVPESAPMVEEIAGFWRKHHGIKR
jgi:hypothetical protein